MAAIAPRPRLDWRALAEDHWRAWHAGAAYDLVRRPASAARGGWWDIYQAAGAKSEWRNSFPMLFSAQDFVAHEAARRAGA